MGAKKVQSVQPVPIPVKKPEDLVFPDAFSDQIYNVLSVYRGNVSTVFEDAGLTPPGVLRHQLYNFIIQGYTEINFRFIDKSDHVYPGAQPVPLSLFVP